MSANLSSEELERYARHLPIPEIGAEGQRRLKEAAVLIVGAGGLGSAAALYLAAAGVGRLGLVDGDAVSLSNLQRQILHGSAVLGQPKVESARRRLLDLNPLVRVEAYAEPFVAANAAALAAPYQIVVDGSDNLPTRFLINEVCVAAGKPFVYGAVFQFEGRASVFDARRGPCYGCLHPVLPPPGAVPDPAVGGVASPLPGTIGTIQAVETLKLLLGIGTPLVGRLLVYNALDLSFETVALRKNPDCKVCGS
ncbi:MAG: molybdopterin-synthase adenylyltransferase MoeB [Anaerolineales bacterium]